MSLHWLAYIFYPSALAILPGDNAGAWGAHAGLAITALVVFILLHYAHHFLVHEIQKRAPKRLGFQRALTDATDFLLAPLAVLALLECAFALEWLIVHEIIDPISPDGNAKWVKYSVFTSLAVLGIAVTYRYRSALKPVRSLSLTETVVSRKALLLFVSADKRLIQAEDGRWVILPKKSGDPAKVTPILEQDTNSSLSPHERLNQIIDRCPTDEPWRWQQNLRAIQPHLKPENPGEAPPLRYIYLIGSHGANGSFPRLPQFVKFLKDVLPDSVDIRIAFAHSTPTSELTPEAALKLAEDPKCAPDFTSFDELIEFIENLVNRILAKDNMKHSDIVVDISGGQKTASVAGAAATMKSNLIIQYIESGIDETGKLSAKAPRVLQYHLQIPDSGH